MKIKRALLALSIISVFGLFGCASSTDFGAVSNTKQELCGNLSPELRQLAVIVMNLKVAAYPDSGFCDPDLLSKEINKQLKKLEDKADVQTESDGLGYKTSSGYRPLGEPSNTAVLLGANEHMDYGTSRISHRPGIDSQNSSFVYEPHVARNQSRSAHSRLHLWESTQSVYEKAG